MKGESAVHLERAEELISASRTMLSNHFFSDSISRSYYAAFHGAKAVLEALGIERKTHQAVWSAFGQEVAKAGLMDSKYHSTGVRLFNRRIKSDYWAKPNDNAEDAQTALTFAAEFVAACRTFLEAHLK